MHGGDLVGEVLRAQGVRHLFTLCGGHISPVLVGAKERGIRVVDTRHEATAVFAADAVARLTGRPGVAAVTAGPGLTNTITAVKNAQLAQSPVVLIGGAAPTVLQGRGALQDIDQMALLRPHVKLARRARRVRDIVPALEQAFRAAADGVPGPVFVELPIDLLYDEALVRQWYGAARSGRTPQERALQAYLRLRVQHLFRGGYSRPVGGRFEPDFLAPDTAAVTEAAQRFAAAQRPVVLVGSQATVGGPDSTERLVWGLEAIGAPVYLSGMARGLLGADHPLQARHKRRDALREADLVLLAGVPADFRLDYGNHIRRSAVLVSANRSRTDLRKNRRPDVGIRGDAALAVAAIADAVGPGERWAQWHEVLRSRDAAREAEIAEQAGAPTEGVNPIRMCREIADALPPGAIVVGDGGDIVATASYVLRPDGPLRWLDPGAFGTLGVGAGFALGAAMVHPDAPVWIVFGDGSVGYSLAEFDTFVRHGVPVVAVVGNDASWSQIAREQVEMLHDDVGTVLAPTRYDQVAAGFGALGLHVDGAGELAGALAKARECGGPALVDVRIGRTDFRKGSISM